MENIPTDDIPVWQRYTLTIEEAARYYHIGEGKLRSIVAEHQTEDFYLAIGNRVLLKRVLFEGFLNAATVL